jgi:hypothetical protein
VIDDYLYLRALDEHIALDFSWTLRRFPLAAHACYLDYQDRRCRCRIIVERPDLLSGAKVPRKWLQIVEGWPPKQPSTPSSPWSIKSCAGIGFDATAELELGVGWI